MVTKEVHASIEQKGEKTMGATAEARKMLVQGHEISGNVAVLNIEEYDDLRDSLKEYKQRYEELVNAFLNGAGYIYYDFRDEDSLLLLSDREVKDIIRKYEPTKFYERVAELKEAEAKKEEVIIDEEK